jgi:hypothetical protein
MVKDWPINRFFTEPNQLIQGTCVSGDPEACRRWFGVGQRAIGCAWPDDTSPLLATARVHLVEWNIPLLASVRPIG